MGILRGRAVLRENQRCSIVADVFGKLMADETRRWSRATSIKPGRLKRAKLLTHAAQRTSYVTRPCPPILERRALLSRGPKSAVFDGFASSDVLARSPEQTELHIVISSGCNFANEAAMTTWTKASLHALLASLLTISTACVVSGAWAQTTVADPLHGFSQNRDKPLKIEGNPGWVQLGARVAIYGDNIRSVQVVLGDTTMKCRFLTVYYEWDEVTGDLKAVDTGPSGSRYIRKLEATGNVLITHQSQTAVGDTGVLDMRANLGTLIGNVVVTRGQDILRGGRLVANLATGVSRLETR